MQDGGIAGLLRRDARLLADVECLVDVDGSGLARSEVCRVPCCNVDRPVHGVDVAVDLGLVIVVLIRHHWDGNLEVDAQLGRRGVRASGRST